MRERNRFETELVQSEAASLRASRSPLGLDLRTVARSNARYARTLGWRRRFVAIARLLNLTTASFADALAVWQKREGLAADGVLGPATWTRMKLRLDVPRPAQRTGTHREYFTPQAGAALSSGQFAQAFDLFLASASVPQEAIRALANSPTMKSKLKDLDKKYVAASDVKASEPIENGLIDKGTRRTRPVLAVIGNPNFSAFLPFGTIDGNAAVDVVVVHAPSGASAEDWILPIALGTARAHGWITRKPRVKDSVGANIRIAIRREALAWYEADRIVSQVFAKDFKGRKAPVPLTTEKMKNVELDVEQKLHPSDLRRTGLEHWVLEEFATEDRVAKKMTLATIEKLRTQADGVPIDRPLGSYLSESFPLFEDPQTGLFIPFDSEYADQRFILRVIHARWTTLGDLNKASIEDILRMREEHQLAFFGGTAAYRK